MQKDNIAKPSCFHPKRKNDVNQYGWHQPSSCSNSVYISNKKENEFKYGNEAVCKKEEGNGCRPKLQYLRFENNKQGRPEKTFGSRAGRYQALGSAIEDQSLPYWNIQKVTEKADERKYYNGNSDYQMFAVSSASRGRKQLKHSGSSPMLALNNKMLEITFSIQSTEPGQSQKQENADPSLLSTLRSARPLQSVQKQPKKQKQPLSDFRRKMMKLQMQAKQKQYRSLIRSSSRQHGKQQKAISSKMKQVLNQLYAIKKQLQ